VLVLLAPRAASSPACRSDEPSRLWYPACPNVAEDTGRACNKKMTDNGGSAFPPNN